MSVNIKRAGNLLEVSSTDAFISALKPQLTYDKRVPTKGWERRESKFKFEKKIIYKQTSPLQLVTPAGFTKRIYTLAQQMSLPFNYVDLRKTVFEVPDFTRVANVDFRAGQEDQLLTICSNDHGIIKAPTGFGKSEMIKWLCQVYPTSKIVICAQQQEIAKGLFERLDKVIRDVGIVGAGYNHPDRVTVSVAKSLQKAPLDGCQLFLYDECHTAAAPGIKRILSSIRDARKFGFSASPFGRHDCADLETEALFGSVICDISYEDAASSGAVADIDVLVVDVNGSPVPYTELVAKERWGFWRNNVRNNLIARVCQALPPTHQSLIIVSKVEHGLALRKLLPDWTFVYGSIDADQRDDFATRGLLDKNEICLTAKNRDEIRKKFESGELKRAIATSVWNTGVDFKHLVYLVRADGGVGEIGNTQIPGRLSRANVKSKGFLIDFNDRFDPTLAARSVKRMRSYSNKGWDISKFTNVEDMIKALNANHK